MLTSAAVFFSSAAYGEPLTATGRIPHIISLVQFPQTRRRIVRHTFQLQIPRDSRAISSLSVGVSSGLTVKKYIKVSDQNGRQIDANIFIDGSKIIVAFPKPVVPGIILKIAMKDVKTSGISNAWLYPVSVKLVGIETDISIGMVQFKVYR